MFALYELCLLLPLLRSCFFAVLSFVHSSYMYLPSLRVFYCGRYCFPSQDVNLDEQQRNMPTTKFYGSQVGGKQTSPQSYTTAPLSLLRADIASAFSVAAFLPFIIFPLRPQASAWLCELYPSPANLWSMFLHLILMLIQLPFILSIPFWLFFPVWWVLGGIALFWTVNQGVSFLLNGRQMKFPSNPKFAKKRPEHAHEEWIFLNGVAVGYFRRNSFFGTDC